MNARGWAIVAKRHADGSYGIFGIDGCANTELLEDLGPVTREEAHRERDRWEAECVENEVEKAERAAGWDPNP